MSDLLDLAALTPDPQNARKHNPDNLRVIQDSLEEVGAARSIVIDEAGTVLAGNATIAAALAAGLTRVQVVDADGQTLIAVRRANLTPAQKMRLALADNRATDLSAFDPEILALLADDQPGVLDGLWTDEEQRALLEQAATDLINFAPASIDEQGRLDERAKVTCPECGHEFVPKA